MEELEDLVRLLAKYIATNKGANLQRTDPEAHALLVKWNKYQRCYKNRIQHFLPRIGDHPDATLHNVITDWDPKAKMEREIRSECPCEGGGCHTYPQNSGTGCSVPARMWLEVE